MTDYDDGETREKNVKIFVRILPLQKPCESCVRIDTECKKIFVRCLQEMKPNRIAVNKEPSYWCFQTDGIFINASQDDVYRVSSQDLVPKILNGISCVLMGYGQTGSGKSFTLSGLRNNWEHRGLVSRIIYDLFLEKSKLKRVSKIQYEISFVELRGKGARDLLLPETENRIRINDRDPFKEISVESVKSQEQALKKIFEAEIRRSIIKGPTYPDSHLATAVITVHATNVSLVTSGYTFTKAKMHIVEMAGIGTPGRPFIRKTALDLGAANLIKSQLGQFFSQLHTAGPIPYNAIRSSNLLKILGDDFPVASVIRFISHVRVTKEDLDVTLSMLRFTGNIARLKPIKIKSSMEYQKDHTVHRLRNEVDALKKELTINQLFLDQEPSLNMTKLRLEQINRSVANYLNGSINDFTLVNATQAQQLLKSVKDFYNRLTVKEMEIEQLKVKYENMSKNMVDVSVSAKQSKESALSADSRIRNRKKSTNSSGRLSEDQETATETHEIGIEEVGSIAKTAAGITLGPCKNDQGDMTPTIPEPVHQIDHQNRIIKLRQTFERFLKDDKEHRKMKEMLDKNARTLATVQQRFMNWINKYFQVKSTLENARDKLSKHQQIRYAIKPEDQEQLIPEAEIIIDRDIACHQKVLLNLEKDVVQAQDEIRRLFQEQREMRSQLNAGFKEYCNEMNAPRLYSNSSMKLLYESSEKASLEVAKRQFNQFQRAMMRKLQMKERIQKTERDSVSCMD